MKWTIQYSLSAANFLYELRGEGASLFEVLGSLKSEPTPGKAESIQTLPDRYQIDVNNYRVIYEVKKSKHLLKILTIQHL